MTASRLTFVWSYRAPKARQCAPTFNRYVPPTLTVRRLGGYPMVQAI